MRYLAIILSLFLLSCNKENKEPIITPIEKLTTTEAYNQVDGIEANLLSLDIYYTSDTETRKPVVIWVHGGGWSIGDKANKIDDKVKLFQSLDYLLVSVNYRLSPFPYEMNNPDRIMYPTHNNDVADAIKWIYDNINQYGGDHNKIALLGHSAGAHLVSLTGTNHSFLESKGLNLSAIKGVAAIDTEGYDVPTKVRENNDLYINAFGTNTTSNRDASPMLHIENGRSYPNFFIAKRGTATRLAFANDFINKLETNGVTVSQVDGSIYDHAGINEAIGATDETLVTDPLVAFFKDCFK